MTRLTIDRAFITRIEHDPRDRHLVEAVLGVARAPGPAVVAEGVETDGRRRLLEDLGCESSQGELVGRPCRTEDFTVLVGGREPAAARRADGAPSNGPGRDGWAPERRGAPQSGVG